MICICDNTHALLLHVFISFCREELEKQKAHERYKKLQEQGKTEQSKKDLGEYFHCVQHIDRKDIYLKNGLFLLGDTHANTTCIVYSLKLGFGRAFSTD